MQAQSGFPHLLRFCQRAAALGISAMLAGTGVYAQTTTDSASAVLLADGGDRLIYTADYLSHYNAISASDLLERIPGIQGLLQGGDQEQRGFGNGGDQVLINGQRVSGKSNDVDAVLDRLQARQVVQIEVIRGSVPGLEVRSQGRVVNVVLEDTLTSSFGTVTAQALHYASGDPGAVAELSYNGSHGALDYSMAVEAERARFHNRSVDRVFSPSGTLTEQEFERAAANNKEYAFSGNTSYTFVNGNQLNLNGLFEQEDESAQEQSSQFGLSGATMVADGGRINREHEDTRFWEIGGDYRYQRNNGHSWTTLLIHSDDSRDETGLFFEVSDDGGPMLNEVQQENSHSVESIARNSYQWSSGDNHQFESGLEVAVNKVREASTLFENENGELSEVALENSASRIQENRYELFVNHTWRISEQLILDNSLDLERSTLNQQGDDIDRRRQFFYARPRLAMSYDVSEQTQLRARIERTVSQLDFGAFVASFNDDDNRFDVINAGNPTIEPETAWEYELSYEYQLQDDRGFVEISAVYADISEHIDLIPLQFQTRQGAATRVAPGNIGDARRLEINVGGSLRLDNFSIAGGVIDADVTVRDTNARDAFTGARRSINDLPEHEWTLSYRQDMQNNVSFGLETGRESLSREYELDYLETSRRDIDLDFFVEWQIADNVLLQLEAENVLRGESKRGRVVFDGSRALGVVEQLERRGSVPDREIGMSVSWSF